MGGEFGGVRARGRIVGRVLGLDLGTMPGARIVAGQDLFMRLAMWRRNLRRYIRDERRRLNRY